MISLYYGKGSVFNMKPIKKINKLDIKTKNRIKNVFGIKNFNELSIF